MIDYSQPATPRSLAKFDSFDRRKVWPLTSNQCRQSWVQIGYAEIPWVNHRLILIFPVGFRIRSWTTQRKKNDVTDKIFRWLPWYRHLMHPMKTPLLAIASLVCMLYPPFVGGPCNGSPPEIWGLHGPWVWNEGWFFSPPSHWGFADILPIRTGTPWNTSWNNTHGR